ncbi:hypothetical protein M3Y98_00704800 [Aphelenchoides besseyi]|nr:hypothetical protein M3Y98_00704800 [Aphelenchoides besseyi]KAI6210391.1 hypothetical protein M3Y96_00323200 [Aphelenchoides besseyi]
MMLRLTTFGCAIVITIASPYGSPRQPQYPQPSEFQQYLSNTESSSEAYGIPLYPDGHAYQQPAYSPVSYSTPEISTSTERTTETTTQSSTTTSTISSSTLSTSTVTTTSTVTVTTEQPTTTSSTTTSTAATTTVSTTSPSSTSTSAPVCNAPNSNSVGLTIDQVSGEINGNVNQTAIAHCSSCTQSRRNFYTSTTQSDPNGAIAQAQVALTVQCPTTQLCLCGSDNVCCTSPSNAAAPTQIQLIPRCDNSGCEMNAVMEGTAMVTQLNCENGQSYTIERQQTTSGVNNQLNSGSYFNTDRVSCRGCDNIRTNNCIGPRENGSA